jgi:hypothetical protein
MWNGALCVTNTMNVRFRAEKDRFAVVWKTVIRPDDPRESASYSSWDFAEQVTLQFRFEN